MSKPVIKSPFKDPVCPQSGTKGDVGAFYADSDLEGIPLVVGVKIAGEPTELVDNLPKGK